MQFTEGDQIQVFIEPASSHRATPASARVDCVTRRIFVLTTSIFIQLNVHIFVYVSDQ